MPSFNKGPNLRTPFGRNEYLRSTDPRPRTESYTVSAASVTAETIDGTTQKILQTGEVMAKILSGPEAGKVGPFQGGTVTNEVQTITVDATGGTWTIVFDGEATANIAATAAAAAVQAALEATANFSAGDVVVTGGPGGAGGATPYVLTFGGKYAGVNVAQVTTTTSLTGGAGTAVVATQTQGGRAGQATDGRGDPANIVGLNDTFLPWQLLEHDENIAAVYDCVAVQAWCFERNAAGARIVLTNATADAMRNAKHIDVLFH